MKTIIKQLKKETRFILSDLGLGPKSGGMIGLDLGTEYFRAARVRKGIKEIPLKDTLIKKLPELRDLANPMHINPDERISINFAGEGLTVKRVNIPSMPPEEITEALKWELKEQFPADIDKAKVRYSILRERQEEDSSKKIELIAAVYNERDIEAKIKELKELDLNVQAVIPAEFAIINYVNHLNLISVDDIVAIVNIGAIATTITIVEEKKISFTRYVPIGGDTITEAMTGVLLSDEGRIEFSKEEAEKIKRKEGISGDKRIMSMIRPVLEKLVTQIKRSVEYCEQQFGAGPLKKIILAGGGAKLKGLKEYLSKEIDTEVMDPLPEIAEAVGLALTGDADINMLPEKFKEEKGKELKKVSIRMISIVLGLIFLFSYGLLSVKSINLKNELDIYRKHLETMQDIKTIRDRMIVLGSAANIISSEDINAGKIMRELSNIVVPSMVLDSLVIKGSGPNVKLSGTVLKEEQLSEFMSLLEVSPMFEKVKLVYSEKNEDYSNGALDFELVCNFER